MSSRINLTLAPSACVGLLASAPWIALATFTVVAASGSTPLLLALLIPGGIWGWQSFRRLGLLQCPDSVVSLRSGKAGLLCQLNNGDEIPVTICAASYLSSALVILKLKPAGNRSGSMVTLITGNAGPLKANAGEPEFRRLRMWLRAGQPDNPY